MTTPPSRGIDATPDTVWILTTGEDHEGGTVTGVYADKRLAFADFLTATQRISRHSRLDTPAVDDDGSIYAHGGCDWIQLRPHNVVTHRAIVGDPIADMADLIARGQHAID